MYTLNAGGHQTSNTAPEFTPREINVLRLARELMTNQEIADKLGISEETVKTHRKNIMKKMGISGKKAMTKFLMSPNLFLMLGISH